MASDASYRYWRESSEKFDYFVVGATGTLCAWVVGTFPEGGLTWPLGLQALGLALLVTSTWAGYKRLETFVHLQSLSHERVILQEKGEAFQRAAIDDPYSAWSYLTALDNVDTGVANRKDAIKQAKQRGVWLYKLRDRALLTGFLLYAVGRIWAQAA